MEAQVPEYGSPPSSPLQARRIRYWMNRDSGPSPTRGAIVTLPTSPVGSLVGRTRVKVGPLLRAKLQQKASALKWRLVQCGNQPISPDGKGRFKLPAKVASARRRAAAAEARKGKSVIEKGDPRAQAPASDDADDASHDGDDGDSEMSVIVPALAPASAEDEELEDDDSDAEDDELETRPADLGSTITLKRLTKIQRKCPNALYDSKSEKWSCSTCKEAKAMCRFARGLFIRSNKVTSRFIEHDKCKVHNSAVEKLNNATAAPTGS